MPRVRSRSAFLWLASITAGAVVACVPPDATPGELAATAEHWERQAPVAHSDCGAIERAHFRSVELLDCGLGPDGVALGHWHLEFDRGSVRYTHTDVTVSGSVRCNDGALEAECWHLRIQGQLDADGRGLVWAGIRYERVD